MGGSVCDLKHLRAPKKSVKGFRDHVAVLQYLERKEKLGMLSAYSAYQRVLEPLSSRGMQLLTPSGWLPTVSLENVFVAIRSETLAEERKLQWFLRKVFYILSLAYLLGNIFF